MDGGLSLVNKDDIQVSRMPRIFSISKPSLHTWTAQDFMKFIIYFIKFPRYQNEISIGSF